MGRDWRGVDDYPPPLPPMSTHFDPRSPNSTQRFRGFLANRQQLGASSFCCQRSPTKAHFFPMVNARLYHLFALMSSKKRFSLGQKDGLLGCRSVVKERLFRAVKRYER